MSNIIEELESKNYRAEIWYDDYSYDPLAGHECRLARFVCKHDRYTLGDSQDVDEELRQMLIASGMKNDYDQVYEYVQDHTYSECLDKIRKLNKVMVVPIYMYEHSAIALSAGGFSDPWDSGQVGFAWVTYKRIREQYGVKRVTKKVFNNAYKSIASDIEYYGHYVNGDCYGFTLYKKCQDPITGKEYETKEDCCGGFIGDLYDIERLDMDLPKELLA